MGDRTILHSDMNCFYASVEMLHHPELEGKPLAVGGDPEARHGIVLTANYIAKKCGVKTGMALWQAKQACPEIIFVPPRMDLYLRFSSMAREIYSEYLQEKRCRSSGAYCTPSPPSRSPVYSHGRHLRYSRWFLHAPLSVLSPCSKVP